jgi:multidrug efflux pump
LLVLLIFIATVGLNVYLFYAAPRGFFPQQDTGRIIGSLQADQSISFQSMSVKLKQMIDIVRADPAVDTVVGFTGVGSGGGFSQINTGTVFVSLKPISQRVTVDEVLARLRPKLAQVPGGRLYLAAVQDLRAGGRQSNAQYQYTLQSENVQDLYTWTPKLVDALEHNPVLTDVSSDQQQRGLETYLTIDRDTTARLGVSPLQIDNTLYDAYGQRQVSTIYSAINQYHVVMEIDPRYTQYPSSLRDVYVATSGGTAPGTATTNAPGGTVTAATTKGTTVIAPTAIPSAAAIGTGSGLASAASSAATARAISNNSARNSFTNALANTGHGSTSAGAAVSTNKETMIPLAAISHYRPGHTALSVNHQGLFVASTISFNLKPGKSLGEAAEEINAAIARINMPSAITGTMAGTAQLFQQSLSKEPILILTAIAAVYILLGVLYESYIHPITILSTLPSAGVGALLALMLFHVEFDIIGLIAVILLIGIVKKNAIMMIDFAIEAKRSRNLNSYEAIFEASLLRFRPILMTTSAAILGAVPLALSFGNGGEIRRPLGIAIVGGLIISQLLTLYTTPVLYLYLDRLSGWSLRMRRRMGRRPQSGPQPAE